MCRGQSSLIIVLFGRGRPPSKGHLGNPGLCFMVAPQGINCSTLDDRMSGIRRQPAEHSTRLVKSHAEARHLLDDLASTGRALLQELDHAAYESCHREARTTLARVFDKRIIVEDFEMAGSPPMKLSDSHTPDVGPVEDRIQGELDYLDKLIDRLPGFRRIRPALR